MTAPRITVSTLPATYAEAERLLAGKDERRVNANGRLSRDTSYCIALVLHHTVVVRFWSDGVTEFSTGGWRSATTAKWMKPAANVLGWRVGREQGTITFRRFDGHGDALVPAFALNRAGEPVVQVAR